jgi:hypothetical protein
MAKVKLARGTQSAYNALSTKDSDTIYVCTNTGNIYLGSTALFESSSYIDASISGKTVTFTTHGTNGTTGTDTLDLGTFQTAAEVSAAISAAISSTYKPAGTIAKNAIVSGLLIAENLGNVYNISEAFTVGSGTGEVSASLFTDAAAGNSYPAGTNIVIVNTGTIASPEYKFDVLAGFIDLSNYQTKVSGATAGNFAGLDSNGNLTDSGYKPGDFKTKQTAYTPTAGTSTGAAGNQYVEQVTQNENGEITVTRKKLPNFTGSGSVGTASDAADAWKTVVHDASLSSTRVLSGNTKSIPAATSSNDGYMTSTQASKLDGIESGSEVNVLESVKVSGTALIIDTSDKSVNIETETAYNATTNKVATMSDVSSAALAWIELS